MKSQKKNSASRAAFVSLGCFKNTVDSEVLAGMLQERGVAVVSEYESPDWLVINTCGFIRDAKEESIAEILAALEKKEKGEVRRVAVFGCLVQRYAREMRKAFSGADILWGVNDIVELAAAIAGDRPAPYADRELFLYSDKHKRLNFTTANSSFIKISEGCGMGCSFCAIPQIRGPYRSRPIRSILKEAEALRRRGVAELNLISQNSTHFGREGGGPSQLPRLLAEISRLDFPWLRVLYLMPEEITPEILDGFAQPTILPYFDLPFQHASERVLERMNRGGGLEKNLRLVEEIRRRFPGAVVRSTFIVGFPGEREEDFAELRDFCRAARLERIGVFAYSPEENTASVTLGGRVKAEKAEERRAILLETGQLTMRRFNRGLIGKTMDFLPLAPWSSNGTIGRIWAQAPEVDGHCEIKTAFREGETMFPVRITGMRRETLRGERK